eukprot:4574325-Pyramimonas_sp.AAC.1
MLSSGRVARAGSTSPWASTRPSCRARPMPRCRSTVKHRVRCLSHCHSEVQPSSGRCPASRPSTRGPSACAATGRARVARARPGSSP